MDMSFALQALATEMVVRRAGELPARVLPVPSQLDREVARLKLASLGVTIDALTGDQEAYRTAWAPDPPVTT